MNFLIIDDDNDFINKIKAKIMEEYVNVSCDTFTSLPQINDLKSEYTVIIIDVLLDKYDGIKLALKLKEKFPSSHYVFISTYKDLIFKTQQLRPLCFIRKSKLDEDFNLMKLLLKEEKQVNKSIQLRTSKDYRNDKIEVVYLNTDDLLFVECNEHKLQIHTIDKEITVYMNLKDFMSLVNDCSNIVRVHKSYAVNMNHIYRINKDTINILDDSSKNMVSLGRRQRKDFIKKYEEYTLL